MTYKYSNLIDNPETYYARAMEYCKVWLLNTEDENILALMGCSDLSEVTYKGLHIQIVYPACSMDMYEIKTRILLFNLKKSDVELGHYILVENEEGEAVDDHISIY
jgi:hypothetical protein